MKWNKIDFLTLRAGNIPVNRSHVFPITIAYLPTVYKKNNYKI